jgi:hypothetical protein
VVHLVILTAQVVALLVFMALVMQVLPVHPVLEQVLAGLVLEALVAALWAVLVLN